MSSISNSLSSPAAQFLSLLNGPASTTNNSAANATGTATPDSTSEISQFSQLLSKLQNLSQTDPSQFKTLTAQIASQLKTAAGNVTGSEAQFLTNLSNKFTQASQDGNISALQPQQTQVSGGHHHHHHGGGASAYNSSTNTDTSSDAQSQGIQSVLQNVFNEVQSA